MDTNMPTAPTPAVRSTVHMPRTGPIPAPRNPKTTSQPVGSRSATHANPTSVLVDPPRLRCPLCRRPNRLPHCGIFKRMLPTLRQQVAQAHGYCLNCLATTHSTLECPSNNACQICMRSHHTLLHRDGGQPQGRGTNRRSQENRAARLRRAEPPLEPWTRTRRQQRNTPTRRRQTRPRSRQPTGLSSVVATLQQLQRLLG